MSETKKSNIESQFVDQDGVVGGTLKKFRHRRGMTLKELAALSGTSVGHLSQLERDICSPSVKTLYAISRALGVTIGQFFDQSGEGANEARYVVRKGDRHHIRFSEGIDDYQLTSDTVKQLSLLYSTLAPGTTLVDPYTHEGEEAGFVISGQLELFLDDTKMLLEAGDSFSFPSLLPHRYGNPGQIETVVIWAATPPSY